jgi:hypothetical protein
MAREDHFSDPFFVNHQECDVYELKKNMGMKNYKIWGSFFLRDLFRYGGYEEFDMEINTVSQNYRKLMKKHRVVKN